MYPPCISSRTNEQKGAWTAWKPWRIPLSRLITAQIAGSRAQTQAVPGVRCCHEHGWLIHVDFNSLAGEPKSPEHTRRAAEQRGVADIAIFRIFGQIRLASSSVCIIPLITAHLLKIKRAARAESDSNPLSLNRALYKFLWIAILLHALIFSR